MLMICMSWWKFCRRTKINYVLQNNFYFKTFIIKDIWTINGLFICMLNKLTVLHVVLNITCYWHQRIERALSWDMITWCSLSWNSTKWIWFQIPSHTSSPEYIGAIKKTNKLDGNFTSQLIRQQKNNVWC